MVQHFQRFGKTTLAVQQRGTFTERGEYMPIIEVLGIANQVDCSRLWHVGNLIRAATMNIEALGITSKKQIDVFFPTTAGPRPNSVIIRVTGLFVRPERTEEVRQHLAKSIGKAMLGYCPAESVLTECFIHPFEKSQGFWSSQ